MMTAHEYALARGWDFSAIEATAKLGVSEEDAAALESTDLSAEELLKYCQDKVEESE